MDVTNDMVSRPNAPLGGDGRFGEIREHASTPNAVACRIFGAADAAERLGISVSTLKRGWPKGFYPAPIKISEHRIGWLESELARFQSERVAERDARIMPKSE